VLLNQLYGNHGKVDVPSIGALIGEMSSWTLDFRKEATPEEGLYTFKAYFTTISAWMFNDPSIRHRVLVEIGRGNQYRLDVAAGARTVLDGQSLLIEGVNLCRP
jgi:hypothetical protein